MRSVWEWRKNHDGAAGRRCDACGGGDTLHGVSAVGGGIGLAVTLGSMPHGQIDAAGVTCVLLTPAARSPRPIHPTLPTIQDRIVGQDAACQAAARALTRSGAGLRDPGRPQAGLLFVGPPGCGKGLLAEALGERRFGGSVLRLDMSECGQRHSVSRLLGAPPGYQGYDNGGTLTEPVRRVKVAGGTVVCVRRPEKAQGCESRWCESEACNGPSCLAERRRRRRR